MSRSADRNQALRASTRAKLLNAALSLFARDGYAATSVRAIANESGVATGLLYSHFSGKEALLRAVFEESMADVRASLALADAVPPSERLAALVRASVAILREHLNFWRLGYATRTQPSVLTALGPALPEWTASTLESLRRYLVDAGSSDPEGDAHALFAQIDGLCQHFALQPDSYPVDAVAERVILRWQQSDFPRPEP